MSKVAAVVVVVDAGVVLVATAVVFAGATAVCGVLLARAVVVVATSGEDAGCPPKIELKNPNAAMIATATPETKAFIHLVVYSRCYTAGI
jgi:hypothetical protein